MATINLDRLRESLAYVEQWMAYRQQVLEIPGVVAAVRFEDQVLLAKGFGFADLEKQIPMTPQHIFRIASHSKTFTATAIMQLVEGGKLRLDDRIGTYIPWLRDRLAAVTIRQVLNHAAGIVRDGKDADYWQLDRPFPDSAELRRLVEEGGDVLPSNDTFKYSNVGYSLLGLIVEATGGLPYNQYVRQHIVDRLGLPDTGPETNSQVRQRLVTGYTARRPGFPQVPIPDVETGALSPATGFYSTAIDLCRYASAHFMGNEELLSDASKREMQQPYWSVEQSDERYGLGFGVIDIGERRMVGHGGGFPGHATRTWFDPRERLAVAVLTNEIGGPAASLASSIVKIIDFALSRPARPQEQPSADYQRFSGRFVNLWSVIDVAHFGDTLVALSPDADDPVKNVTELEVEDGDTLRIVKTNGYGSPGETIRYVRDDAGEVTRIVLGGGSYYPLEIYRERFLRQHGV